MIAINPHATSSIEDAPGLLVLGLNHDTAPIQVREQFSVSGEQLQDLLVTVRRKAGECVILSTCNRFELYLLLPGHQAPEEVLTRTFGETAPSLQPYMYSHYASEASRHLFRVASGLDSLVLGEVQILGQVQRAWQAAQKARVAGPVLSQLFHRAVAFGKRVHSETDISSRPASVSYAAVVLARQIFGSALESKRVLVIGTGEVGEGIARCLHEHGLHATVVAHRHIERAAGLARRYEAEVATWDELPGQLAAADVVISSTAAPHTVLQRQQIEEAMSNRHGRPLYLIDLAVPRDIDPGAAEVPGVHLHNIDDLQAVVHTSLAERQTALPQVEAMLEDEVRKFEHWLSTRSAAPNIHELQQHADEAVRAELEWALAKLPGLSVRERQVVEAMASRLRGKLLHRPIQWLKAQAHEGAQPSYSIEDLDVAQVNELFFAGVEEPTNQFTGESEADAGTG